MATANQTSDQACSTTPSQSATFKAIGPEEVDRRLRELHANRERIGPKHWPCRVNTFEISADAEVAARQQAAIGKLELLRGHMHQHVEAGGGLVLYGPTGTGKDHLLVAAVKWAIMNCGFTVRWINGQDLAGCFRDAISGADSEEAIVRRFSHPQILAISDPIPPKGEASAYVASALYRVVDNRYRQGKSTWCSINAMTAVEAANALTAPVFDRLRDNALTICCNWPSYRPTNKPAWLED